MENVKEKGKGKDSYKIWYSNFQMNFFNIYEGKLRETHVVLRYHNSFRVVSYSQAEADGSFGLF